MSAVRVAFRELYQVFGWFNGGDLQADFATLRRDYRQMRWGRWSDWLREEGSAAATR